LNASILAELPCPPGFGPIPVQAGLVPPPPSPQSQIVPQKQPQNDPEQPQGDEAVKKPSVKKMKSLQDKQLAELQKRQFHEFFQDCLLKKLFKTILCRQAQFKSAALSAKKAGQIEQAKEYLKQSKGFDNLIEAAKSGLPVDFKTLPIAPQATRGTYNKL
jgi:coiled-coil and C2 domain-containing protein 1